MTPERLQELQTGKMHLGRFFTYEGKSPFELDIFGNPIKWIFEDGDIDFPLELQSQLEKCRICPVKS